MDVPAMLLDWKGEKKGKQQSYRNLREKMKWIISDITDNAFKQEKIVSNKKMYGVRKALYMPNEGNKIICQSRGMPMPASWHFGTRKGGIPETDRIVHL